MLIELSNVVFGYARRPVVRVGQLGLRAGQCLGVFGANGSGKTTLMRGIVGLLRPIEGRVQRSASLRVGYLQQLRSMDPRWPMSGLDAAAMASSAQTTFGWLGRRIDPVRRAMRALDVEALADRPFAKLSGGQQQRLLLAGAMANDPTVLVLDEPTDGLDVRSRRMLLDTLRAAVSNGLSVILISHEVEDFVDLCEQVVWVHPAEAPDQPSGVEVLPTDRLAERLFAHEGT